MTGFAGRFINATFYFVAALGIVSLGILLTLLVALALLALRLAC